MYDVCLLCGFGDRFRLVVRNVVLSLVISFFWV